MAKLERLRDIAGGVAVLCGGPGGEREVSLASGGNVHQALKDAGLPNFLAVVPETHPDRYLEELDCRIAVMMLHGEFGEDGAAQSILERRGIAFSGSDSRSCALAMDKCAVKNLCLAHSIPTPRWVVADNPAEAARDCEERNLRYPLFVKPNYRGSSVGVTRVDSPGGMAPAVEKALAMDRLALIEELVEGRELTVGWLDGKVLPIIDLRAEGEFYDYNAKYISENTRYVCPAELPEDLRDTIRGYAARVAALVGSRDLARVDIMLGKDGPKVLELNSLPGFTTHSLLPMAAAAAGIAMPELCLSLVFMAAKRAGIVG